MNDLALTEESGVSGKQKFEFLKRKIATIAKGKERESKKKKWETESWDRRDEATDS